MPEKKPYEKQAITNLQRYLRQLSYQYPEITSPPIDGIFESVTRQSLMDFQIQQGLVPTGVADRVTWELLFDTYTKSILLYSPSEAILIFPRNTNDYKLKLGDSSIYVVLLQYMLQELRRDYGDIFDISVDGKYDQETLDAVKQFQSLNGLFPNGEVNKNTWNAITQSYNRRVHEYQQ